MTIRLTLRVLLAYMDDVLETSEAEEVKQKIAESDVAQQLIERIRRDMGRTDITAPPVMGDARYDPNRFSEYLDRLLQPDQVEEVEKQVLGSDALLSEAGSCHHILKLILDGPPQFDSAMREKMYGLMQQVAAAQSGIMTADGKPAVPVEADPTAPGLGDSKSKEEIETIAQEVLSSERPAIPVTHAAAPGKVEPHAKPEVPEYLIESASPPWLVPTAAIAVVVLICVIIFAAVQNMPVATTNGGTPTAATPIVPLATGSLTGAGDVTGTPDATGLSTTIPTGEPTGIPTTEPTQAPTPLVTSVPTTIPTTIPTTPTGGGEATADSTAKGIATGEGTKPPPMPIPMDDPEKEPKEAPIPRVELGSYTTPEALLLHFEPAVGNQPAQWRRVPPRAVVFSGDRLVALPTYRCTLDLAGSVSVDLVGGTIVDLLPPDAAGVMQIRLIEGRLTMRALKEDAKLKILSLDYEWLFTLTEMDTLLGVEIHPQRDPGGNPDTDRVKVVATSFGLATGKAGIDDGQAQIALNNGPSRGTLVPLKEIGPGPFSWITTSDVSPIDQRASVYIQKELQTDDSAGSRLKELEQDRRLENRRLCLRSLALIGEFEPLFIAIGQEDLPQQSFRDDLIVHLRDTLALTPEYPKMVRAALEKYKPEQAEMMFRMLLGYTDDQLARGEATQLVAALDHSDLAIRAVAFWNLRSITGITLNYRPEVDAEKRMKPIAAWREKLEQGAIKHKAT